MKLEAFLFDMDGVVIDSEIYNDKSTAKLLKEFNKEYEKEVLKPLTLGKNDVEGMEEIVKYYNLPITGKEFCDRRYATRLHFYREKIPYIEGFLEFFNLLIKEFPIKKAIVTSCRQDFFEAIDARLKISEKFDNNIFRSHMVKRNKPFPDIFLYAAEKIGTKCENSVVIEDSPNGMISGYKAGCKAIIGTTMTLSKENVVKRLKDELTEPEIKENILFIDNFSKKSYEKIKEFIEKKFKKL